MDQSTFIKNFQPEKLARAVIRQCGGWDCFKDTAQDVTRHGAAGGFSGFIYYSDTEAFAKRNKAEILEYAKEMANEIGESLYGMIAGFNCPKISEGEAAEAIHNPRSDDRTQVLNALAWFALEEVSRRWVDLNEDC
jgi:hypothetical protein